MRKSMLKREVARSHKIIAEYLVGLGAEKIDRSWSALAYRLKTPAGPLVLSMHTEDGASVFGRFDDIDRAVACLGETYQDFNRFSGKWNLHVYAGGDKIAPEDVLAQFKARIERLLVRDSPDDVDVAYVRGAREARYRERGWPV